VSAPATAWATWCALAISLLSAIFAGLAAYFTGQQWQEAHTQVLLAVKPSVDFFVASDPDDQPVGIAIENAGPGLAIVKSIIFYVDRKPVANADEVWKSYAKLTESELEYTVVDPDDALAVGKETWLIQFRRQRAGKPATKDIERFADFIDQNLAIEVRFCSIKGDCWTKCSDAGRCG
jgi:hypothetical protein